MFRLACPAWYVPRITVLLLRLSSLVELFQIGYHCMFLNASTSLSLVSGITLPVVVAVSLYVSNCTPHSISWWFPLVTGFVRIISYSHPSTV